MRKFVIPVSIVLLLALPGVVAHVIGKGEGEASGSGAAVLDVVTPHNQDIRNEFAPAFSAWHLKKYGKAVDVRFGTPGGTNDISRLLRATYEGSEKNPNFKPPYDVAWGGGDFFFDREIKDYLQPMDLPEGVLKSAYPEPSLAGVRLYDYAVGQKPRWAGVCLSAFGIIYNPDVYKGMGLPAPARWDDLARPDLSGWVALANPASSGSAAVAYSMVLQRAMADEEPALLARRPELAKMSTSDKMKDKEYKATVTAGWKKGMAKLTLIAANARYFSDSATQPPADVSAGDAAAGVAIDFYGRIYEGTTPGREKLVVPVAATAITPDPLGILKGVKGEQYELANHFVEYLLTPEAQQVWIGRAGAPNGPRLRSLYRPPIRKDVYTAGNEANWTNPDLNPFTDAGGFNQRGEWNALLSETRMVWTIAWIDDRAQLRDAYRAVLRVADAAKRESLLADLADLPMTYERLEGIRADLKKQPPAQSDEYRARLRIDLGKEFAEHYRKVREKAEG